MVTIHTIYTKLLAHQCRLLMPFTNILDPDQAQHYVWLDLDPICFIRGSVKNNWALPHNIFALYCIQQMWLFSIGIISHLCFDPEELP